MLFQNREVIQGILASEHSQRSGTKAARGKLLRTIAGGGCYRSRRMSLSLQLSPVQHTTAREKNAESCGLWPVSVALHVSYSTYPYQEYEYGPNHVYMDRLLVQVPT